MKLNRVTVWRRKKRADAAREVQPRAGRREWSDAGARIQIKFVAAVLYLQNTRGFCDWPEVRPAQRKVQFGCQFHHADFKLLRALLALARLYHPGLLATAVCELVPMNYRTRGGQGSASKLDLGWRARRSLDQRGAARDPRLLDAREVEEGDAALAAPVSDVDLWQERLARFMPEAIAEKWALRGEKVGFDGDWQTEVLKLIPHGSQARTARRKVKGTPVHRLPLFGMEPSRKMASHWRNHRDYRRALAALRGLLTGPEPVAPYAAGEFPGAQVDTLGTEAFRQFWIQRRLMTQGMTPHALRAFHLKERQDYLAHVRRMEKQEGRKVVTSLRPT